MNALGPDGRSGVAHCDDCGDKVDNHRESLGVPADEIAEIREINGKEVHIHGVGLFALPSSLGLKEWQDRHNDPAISPTTHRQRNTVAIFLARVMATYCSFC